MKTFRKHCASYTLVEILISVLCVSIICTAVMTDYIALLKGFQTTNTYRDLHANARYAMDDLTRDLRGASALTSGTSNSLTLTLPLLGSTQTVTYAQSGNTFTRRVVVGASTNTATLARDVESVAFTYYVRDNSTTTNATYAYNIHAKITTSQTITGNRKVDFIQTRTLMRNKHN